MKTMEEKLHELSDKIVSYWWNQHQPFEETLVQTQIRNRKEISKIVKEGIDNAVVYRQHRVDKEVCEDYLKGLADYLDMRLDAEVDRKHRMIIETQMDVIKETIHIISLYKPKT